MAAKRIIDLLSDLEKDQADPCYILDKAYQRARSMIEIGDKVLKIEFQKGKDLTKIAKKLINFRERQEDLLMDKMLWLPGYHSEAYAIYRILEESEKVPNHFGYKEDYEHDYFQITFGIYDDGLALLYEPKQEVIYNLIELNNETMIEFLGKPEQDPVVDEFVCWDCINQYTLYKNLFRVQNGG